MGKHRVSLWQSCFGGCAKVEDLPSPRPSATPPTRQRSTTRLSCSDVSTTDLSSSFLSANLIMFTIAELKAATQGFSSGNFIGEGGFGPVYKGHVDEKMRAAGVKPQAVAVKVLDLDGMQGHKEWMTEVILLGQLRHPHLVKLVGYCYEADHRMLVYEFMARGSLENHLFKRYASLSWEHRIKIAFGAAKGLAFLHGVDQPVIYRDFKASNILLDADYKAKLSDFGLAKDGPEGDDTHVSTRVMGTHGYAAPEYVMTGHLTAKSDVYSFGVVLLELLTGRRSVDNTRPSREQNLVDWARPLLTNPRKLNQIIDPRLEGQFSAKGAQKVAELAYHCLSHLPKSRPHMSAVVEVLEPILNYKDILPSTFVFDVNGTNGKLDSNENSKGGSMKEKQTVEDRERGAEKPKNITNHRSHHRHRNNRRQRGSTKATVYSDTALYRKSPRRAI